MSSVASGDLLDLRLVDPLIEGLLPRLPDTALACLQGSCYKFRVLVQGHKPSMLKLNWQRVLFEVWDFAPFTHVTTNEGFLSQHARCGSWGSQYSLATLLKLATWYRTMGANQLIPAHGLGTYQPRAMLPSAYVSGIHISEICLLNDPSAISNRIYCWLGERKLASGGLDAPELNRREYGRQAFHSESGYDATDEERAYACQRAVVEVFRSELTKDAAGLEL